MNTEIVKKIIDNCRDLRLEWLVLGIGDMLLTDLEIQRVTERKELAKIRRNTIAGNSEEKTKSTEKAFIENTDTKTKSTEKAFIKNEGKNEGFFEENEKYKKGLHFGRDDIAENRVTKFMRRTDNNAGMQQIPLYSIEAFAGLVPLFNEATVSATEEYISIPNLPKCDGAVHVTGDSMYPLLKSGDIVLYKQINDIVNNIFWGEMYLVSLDVEGEEYITVKYIQKSEIEDHVRLVSHNQHHSPKNVRVDKIKALAFVKASIRINSMK